MGEGQHNGKPLKTMKDLYLCFECDINAIVDYVSSRNGPITQGVVFAELVDAVEDMKVELRNARERLQERFDTEEAMELAATEKAKRAVAAAAAAAKTTEAPRRTRRAAAAATTATTATVGHKKPGANRKPVAAEPKRRGRPPKNR